LATTVFAKFIHHLKGVFLMLDALGLVAFSLIGCNVALQLNYPVVVVIMAGMLTGICGGVLRDVLCNQVPVVFCRELYASVSLFVCALFLVLRSFGVDTELGTAICFVSGFGFRMLALRFGWKLPTFSYQQRWD
jgi:uncharacterized membrane protein YeiH